MLVLPKWNDNIRIGQPGVAPVQEPLVSCVFLHRRHTNGGHACGLRAQVDQWTLTISRMLADLEGPSGDGDSGTVLVIARVVNGRWPKRGVNGSCSLALRTPLSEVVDRFRNTRKAGSIQSAHKADFAATRTNHPRSRHRQSPLSSSTTGAQIRVSQRYLTAPTSAFSGGYLRERIKCRVP